jgi:hypothetical protein
MTRRAAEQTAQPQGRLRDLHPAKAPDAALVGGGARFASLRVDTCPTRAGAQTFMIDCSVFSGSAWGGGALATL